MNPEALARKQIDSLLVHAGWEVQDRAGMSLFGRKPGRERPWTERVWFYDYRTNVHHTLKQNPLARADLDEFVTCYHPANRHERAATWGEDNPDGRRRNYGIDDILARDKVNLDIFWLRDDLLAGSDCLSDPGLIAAEIVEDLEAALEQFRLIAEDLGEGVAEDQDVAGEFSHDG